MYRRIVFASTQYTSFEDASKVLAELCDLSLPAKRIWRAVKRIGEECVEERSQAVAQFEKLTLPARRESPVPQAPCVACVQIDGGRFQLRERVRSTDCEQPAPVCETSVPETTTPLVPSPDVEKPNAAEDDGNEGYWREFKAGVLLSMKSQVHEEDPCPKLPDTFVDPGKMRKRARDIKRFTSDSAVSTAAEPQAEPEADAWQGRPEVLVKSVVATSGDVDQFAPLIATAAYERGFHAAERKAFIGDGSSTIWGVFRRFFSHDTPIVDFVHALMYVYAAAMAGRSANEGWLSYRDWSQWLWSGEIDLLLAAMAERLQALGAPDKGETGTPRAQIAKSAGYLANHRGKMNYPEYRKKGLPHTSCLIESTVKPINRRVKGTEKFWSKGADPILQLVADRLSEPTVTAEFWDRRVKRLMASAADQTAA